MKVGQTVFYYPNNGDDEVKAHNGDAHYCEAVVTDVDEENSTVDLDIMEGEAIAFTRTAVTSKVAAKTPMFTLKPLGANTHG